jgi:AcrR family transcriptional regulator
MVRIVKDADVRRDELLDTALALFLEIGYEHTSVEHITQTVGVAKGTFYHYFATKQDLLEQLVERYSAALFDEIDAALHTADGDAAERFRALMAASSAAKLGRRNETLLLTASLYSDDNREMLNRLREGWIERTRPFIRSIVVQGCAEGTFHVPDVDAMTEICLSLWFDYGIRIGRLFFEAKDDRSKAQVMLSAMDTLVLAEERILGAAPGSLGVDLGPAVEAILGND